MYEYSIIILSRKYIYDVLILIYAKTCEIDRFDCFDSKSNIDVTRWK